MANGIVCKRCGYWEADHLGALFTDEKLELAEFNAKHPQLVACTGFEASGLMERDRKKLPYDMAASLAPDENVVESKPVDDGLVMESDK
jgi:hypothetical protein